MTHQTNDEMAASLYPDMAAAKPEADNVPPARNLPWERMYPEMKEQPAVAAPAANAAIAQNVEEAPRLDGSKFDAMHGHMHRETRQPELTVDELVAQPLTDADRMYPEGGRHLESAAEYDQQTLSEPFDTLQMQARYDGNEEETAILAEGRQQAAEVLHGMAVPSEAARGIAGELESWNVRWIKGDLPDLDEMDSTRQKTEAGLRKEWGAKYNANVQLARQAYQEAAKQLPWLRNLVEDAGAGNSAALLRHFATIGLNNARNRRGSGGNRK